MSKSCHFKNRNIVLAEETGEPEDNSLIVVKYRSIKDSLPDTSSELTHLTGYRNILHK